MAIAFPSLIPTSQTFGIHYNTFINQSTLVGTVNTIELPGARWMGSVTFSDLTSTDTAKLRAFIAELRGSSGRFLYGDLGLTVPQDSAFSHTGSLTIDASPSPTNRIIYVSPDSPSTFTEGDYIQIGDDNDSPELKTIISVSGGPGQQGLTVEPLIRRSVASLAGTNVYYNNPKTEFALINEKQLMWNIRSKAHLSDFNLDFVEFF